MIDLKQLQARLGLPPDGVAGAPTLTALFERMGATSAVAAELGLAGAVDLPAYGLLANGLRLAHFLAQTAHESDGFHAMEEYADGSAYEGRQDLGNVEPGDGPRYKGRGPLQLTGRANYRAYGIALGIDFELHPEIVALPSLGLLAACRFWSVNGLNTLADADNFTAITRRIDGGLNGLADRQQRLAQAKALVL